MPCRTDDCDSPQLTRKTYEDQFEHDSTLADIFCATMAEIEALGNVNDRLNFNILQRMPIKAQSWWTKHKARDKKRIEKEIAEKRTERERKAALQKLTPYERKLLGVK